MGSDPDAPSLQVDVEEEHRAHLGQRRRPEVAQSKDARGSRHRLHEEVRA